MAGNHIAVAAIDFGTTYSGYAFSFRHQFEKDPTEINTPVWPGGYSDKTPTSILFDERQSFIAFGHEAEEQYRGLVEDGNHRRYYFFRHFKMKLYDKESLSASLELEDISGKNMLAMDVFTAAIKHLRCDLLKRVKYQTTGVKEGDILWVLTVPAIWTDPAKKFMRTCAEKAGITHEKLLLCLEPEAASILGRHEPIKITSTGEAKTFSPGAKYLILDAGGGTIDITVHEVTDSGTLKELHRASGGDWGGTSVNKAFFAFLDDLLGTGTVERFKQENQSDYLELFERFEIKKRDALDKTSIGLPPDMFSKEKLQSELSNMPGVTLVKTKLRFEKQIMKTFFLEACTETVKLINEILNFPETKSVKTILMVGGFSKSQFLQEEIKKAFVDKQLIIPKDAGLSVLKGAVIFGHDPKIISQRRCRYTYGVSMCDSFQKGVHPESKKIVVEGIEKCQDIFDKHVSVGQQVNFGEMQDGHKYFPLETNQSQIRFKFYASSSQDPMYVTDPSCTKLGELLVNVHTPSLLGRLFGGDTDRGVWVSMRFGGTEIEATAVVAYNNESLWVQLEFLD